MSFMPNESADCGLIDPMSGLLKRFQQDRSLQQDQIALSQRVESSKTQFRTQNTTNGPILNKQLTEGFVKDELNKARLSTNAFELGSLNRELELIQPKQPSADWTIDFMQHQQSTAVPQQFEGFEEIYHQNNRPQQAQVGNWASEFDQFQTNHPTSILTQTERVAFERAFDVAKQETQMNWEGDFATQEFLEFESMTKDEPLIAKDENEALAKTATMLLDSVDIESNPKFKNSQFMHLMRRLRDNEVQVEGNKMVETKGKSGWASEFESTLSRQSPDGFTANMNRLQSGNMMSTEFIQNAGGGFTEDFYFEQKQHPSSDGWASEFDQHNEIGTEEPHKLLGTEPEDWLNEFDRNMDQLKKNQDREWSDMQKNWDESEQGYRDIGSEYDVYNFAMSNPYLLYPELIEGREHFNLADSILALEAKAQLKISDPDAWRMLGLRQQENEKDNAAIAAFRQAIKLDPHLLDVWLALAVSYTNESCKKEAYDALEQWIMNNEKYKHLIKSHQKGKMIPDDRHAYITRMFIEAARNFPGIQMDPDVQIGLGVLFNMSEEYDKAIDCFKAALASKPQDYMLWNKLGATLANSRNPETAVDAYFNAVEINPSYVRARYNLAMSFMKLGQYRESAEHLLVALSLQQSNKGLADGITRLGLDRNNSISIPGGTSDNIWRTLRMLMLTMNRDDLAKHCDSHHLDPFHVEFEF
ncbi:hypothetical protein G6F48_007682 [Rhizopus delemar]|nr:hypothetical protein G6F48_007682 [Rhizopus delemar]